jgi:hypothetical protein
MIGFFIVLKMNINNENMDADKRTINNIIDIIEVGDILFT